jgi:hypothetical protein
MPMRRSTVELGPPWCQLLRNVRGGGLAGDDRERQADVIHGSS